MVSKPTQRRVSEPPPAYRPTPGDPVVDEATGFVGEFQSTLHLTPYTEGRRSSRSYIRPFGGGQEVEADPDRLRAATDAEVLSARVAQENRRSRERWGW